MTDTVRNEWPMGLIMLNVDQRPDSDGKSVPHYDVVDGQQRLRTLFEYMEGKEEWAGNPRKKGGTFVPYGSLSEASQDRFREYRVSVALMRDYETDEILDVFSKLQNGRPLRIGERIKALRSPHKDYLRKVTEHDLFDLTGASAWLKAKDGHWNLSAGFYKGFYNNNPLERHEYDQLAKFLQDTQSFDDKRAEKASSDCRRILNILRKILQEAKEEEPAFVEKVRSPRLIKWAFACITELDQTYSLTGKEHLLAEGLRHYHLVRERDQSAEWIAYLNTGRTGRIDTDDVRVCLEHLKNCMIQSSHLVPKDSNRHFSPPQRMEIYKQGNGQCATCKIPLSKTNFHADHIVPHSSGGKTTAENGRALCTGCNLKKGSFP